MIHRLLDVYKIWIQNTSKSYFQEEHKWYLSVGFKNKGVNGQQHVAEQNKRYDRHVNLGILLNLT